MWKVDAASRRVLYFSCAERGETPRLLLSCLALNRNMTSIWLRRRFAGDRLSPGMSTLRKKSGGWIRRTGKRGPNGRGICRWCGSEVPIGRRTFCGDDCVHEWRLRTDPGYLRDQVLARDRGVCAVCGLDTLEFCRRLQLVPARKRRALRRQLDLHARRRSFWDADHILPVAEGGGECDLSNLRTLCLWCHQAHTAQLRCRLKNRRRTPVSINQK
jgi:5-methylcytosine-specific restriction enzyme A